MTTAEAIAAWRALDAAEREVAANMIRGFPARQSWPTQNGCDIAAAALEALAEVK